MRRTLLLVVTMVGLGCGGAELGAAAVRGRLYGHSFDFTSAVTLRGAGPFRLQIARPDGAGDLSSLADGAASGRLIEVTVPRLPESRVPVPLGAEELTAATAQVTLVRPGPAEREARQSGPDLLFADGSFIAQPTAGELVLELDGTRPGDGLRGTLVLHFQTGETLTATFAGALAD